MYFIILHVVSSNTYILKYTPKQKAPKRRKSLGPQRLILKTILALAKAVTLVDWFLLKTDERLPLFLRPIVFYTAAKSLP